LLEQITPLILTYNEAPNIQRTLRQLKWAHRIVVIDSGSTDDTSNFIKEYKQADIIQHDFRDFATQCNFGLTQVTTPWVLSLDADYELSDALVWELQSLSPSLDVAGYSARFVYRVFGRPLRASLYPARVVLYRRIRAKYRQEGHGHRVLLDGEIAPLQGKIFHDDRKPLARWFASQQRYAYEEAGFLLGHRHDELNHVDRVRLMAWPAPLAVFIYVLLVKRCIFDGWPGWYYALQRLLAEVLVALEIIDQRLANAKKLPESSGTAKR
jgi:glycosyltransferase involved in cell wall biosynthesis